MSLSNDALSITGYGQPYRWNAAVEVGTPTVVTYSFQNEQSAYDTEGRPGFAAFGDAHKAYVRTALDLWAAQSGVSFVERDSGGQIRFSMFDMNGLTNATGNPLSGYAYYPSVWTSSTGADYIPMDTLGGDVFLNANYYADNASTLSPGVRGYSILIHEIGHALGLKHPFSGDPVIDSSHDTGSVTVMSYNRSQGTTSLGTADVEATKFVYGDASYATQFDGVSQIVTQTATGASERLLGTELKDHLVGMGGNDVLAGAYGDDTLDGGAGLDTARYFSPHTQFTITLAPGGADTVADRSGIEGTDTLINVERLQFTDGVLALDTDGVAGQVYRLYQAAFGRTPDTVGLSSNIGLVDNGLTLHDMANAFAVSGEFKALFGANASDEEYINALYNNVLGRDADDAGLAGWREALATGSDRGHVLTGFSESRENIALVAPAIDDGIWLG